MKKVRKTLDLPEVLVGKVEEFRKENMITTFTGALIEVIKIGLGI